ncbi:MAG: trehalose-phosphatase, partial [Actinomycetota bacterium]
MEAPALKRLTEIADSAGIFLDFDGTLAEIAPTPAEVVPASGAVEVLGGLARRCALLAVVTGRRAADIRALLPLDGVEVFGVYGLEGAAAAGSTAPVRTELERIAGLVPGAWVEDKGVSLTLHYRLAADPDSAADVLGSKVAALARQRGLVVIEGKRAVEVASERVPGKGAVIEGEIQARRLPAALYAGDDIADLDAFDAL